MTDPDPGPPGTRTADRFDVFLCFARADPVGVATAELVETALLGDGLRVFRAARIDDFDPVTSEVTEAIDGSRVVLVCCSRVLPTRYACQWELTAAVAAARRHGDPADRVLVIDPPPGLAEFFTGPVTAANLPGLVARVRRKVAAADVPLGAPGRRPQLTDPALRAVHDVLAAPGSRPVVIRGLPGAGKTALAERYAHLFAGAFPGGVLRTGPFGHHAPDDFLAQFHLGLARAAEDRLGTDVSGLDLDRLRALLADRIDAAREQVLVLVDDVPAGLPPAVLDRLLLPGDQVRTLVTSRCGRSPWDAAVVELAGLPAEAGLRLFTEFRAPTGDSERTAVLRWVDRCGGDPVTVGAGALAVRDRPGPLTEAVLAALPDTAPQAVRDLLAALGPVACDLVRLGALLAPVPIPPELASEVLGAAGFGAAVEELVAHRFATPVDGGLQLSALAVDVARTGSAGAEPARAAEVVLAWLAGGRGRRDFLLQHARALAEVAPAHRVRLLRPVAAAHEEHGDPATAGEVHAAILSTGEATSADFTAAARVEIACGLYAEAAGHAREALALAAGESERYAAGLTAAQALDCRGDYTAADRMFWRDTGDRLPDAGEERYRAAAAGALARRVRGRARDAVAFLEPILAEVRDELAPAVRLEYARSLRLAGDPRRARDVAGEVVAALRAAGRERHPRCTEAELVHADAVLALDLAGPPGRERSAAELRELETGYAKRHGTENPVTLTATALADRALLALGRPGHALAALSATERVVLRVLGGDHPLRYRIRHGMGLAHAQLREFGRQAELLEDIVEPQIRLLGRAHPETVESRLDLGTALALSGRGPRDRATGLVDDAARDAQGTGLAAKAQAAQRVVRLSPSVVSALGIVERPGS